MHLTRAFSFCAILLILLSINSLAQDKIITLTNDTILCKINRISEKSIYYSKNEVKLKLPRERIRSWEINQVEIQKPVQLFENQTGKWRLSTEGGFGYRIASAKESKEQLRNQGFTSEEVDSYFRQIRTGLKTSGQIHYMFWDNFGLGLDYQYHQSSGKISGVVDPQDNLTLLYTKIKDNVYTNYAGLSLYYQYWTNPKFKLYYQISLGITFYRDETVSTFESSLITGKAFGGNTEIGCEYFLCKNIAVAINADFFQSTISKIKFNNGSTTFKYDLEDELMEGLARIDFGIGLKFYW